MSDFEKIRQGRPKVSLWGGFGCVIMVFMGLEHFAAGAGEAVHMLGRTKLVGLTSQRNELYQAETKWRGDREGAGKTISTQGARDLVGETIFHPAMDELPGIENLRASFNAKKQVKFFSDAWAAAHPQLPEDAHGFTTSAGLIGLRRIGDENNVTQMGTVTHEASHLLGRQFMVDNNLWKPAPHSWPMARLHVHVARQVLGNKHAAELRHYYQSHGVDYGD